MAALPAGTKAPDFSLPAISSYKVEDRDKNKNKNNDSAIFELQTALKHGPVLAAFFKVSCPTCQYTFPYLERLHKLHGDTKITVVGISQNNESDTTAFLKEYGVTFRTLLDDPNGYAVSNAYGLTNVPTLFFIRQDGTIQLTSVGWVKQEIEEINQKLASAQQTTPPPLFKPGEDVKDFRAG